ncbi:MAG: hypothetical protein K2X48_03165 [Chitinophagaceae bacterium]|nr:hypothetical protein [Chitinophagaceae bacterium]
MKTLLSFILLFFAFSAFAQQQVESIQLDSCNQYAAPGETAFESMAVRVEQSAQWNNSKTSMDDFFDTFFKQYVQKRAGGRITLSLLISKDGKCCFYQAQPNSNVRPDFKELKRLLDQTTWTPATQNGQAVKSAKVLFINFDGKRVSVSSLD